MPFQYIRRDVKYKTRESMKTPSKFFLHVWAKRKTWIFLLLSHGASLFFSVFEPPPDPPNSARERARPMGGAVAPPDKSDLGSSIRLCSYLLYQKFIKSESGGKKKGVKGKNELPPPVLKILTARPADYGGTSPLSYSLPFSSTFAEGSIWSII